MTGLWQVSDRASYSFAERAIFDDTYVNNLSFLMDMRIMLKTVSVTIRGTGR